MPGDSGIRELQFVSIGAVSPALLADVVARVSRRVAVPCRIVAAGAPFPLTDLRGRSQVDADKLLSEVEARATSPGAVLAALSAHDMGNPVFTHFFGRARLAGNALVVSLARLSPAYYGLPEDPALHARRAALEVVHELGHVAGLHHCRTGTCLMSLARNVEAIDQRGASFCERCAAAMPREASGEAHA